MLSNKQTKRLHKGYIDFKKIGTVWVYLKTVVPFLDTRRKMDSHFLKN